MRKFAAKQALTVYFSLLVLITFVSPQRVMSADSAQAGSIATLETRFFEHAYASDTMSNRLARLEKMIFGEAKEGSDSDRLAALLNAVPQTVADSPKGSNTFPGAPAESQIAAGDRSGQAQQSDNADSGDGQDRLDGQDPAGGQSAEDYPRVTEIEKSLLGKAYPNEPIRQRLDQLELKAFGKATSNADLADRVDRLEQYAERKSGSDRGRLAGAGPQFDLSQEPVQSAPIEAKVSWLEMQILGHTNPHTPMIERLRPLEKAMFPTDPNDIHGSIPEQVHMLIGAVELLSKQQQGAAPSDQNLSLQPLLNRKQPSANSSLYPPASQGAQGAYQAAYPGGQAAGSPRYGSRQYSSASYGMSSQQGAAPPPSYVNSYSAPRATTYGGSYPSPPASLAYGSTAPAQGAPVYQQGQPYPQTSTSAQHHSSKGHPLLKGLAHVLGQVGQMAVGSIGGGMMGGYPGGYGSPYGMGYPSGGVFGWP